jgi:hypothetical protein
MTRLLTASLSIAGVCAVSICTFGCSRVVKANTAKTVAVQSASNAPAISDIDWVKNGKLPEYKDTAVRQAFEKTFQDPEWKSAVNIQWEGVVRFHGTLKYTVLREAGFYIGTWNGVSQGNEAERQISEARRRCSVEGGQPETSSPDDVVPGTCMAKAYQSLVVPVSFEFTLSSDKRGVEMTLPDPVFQKFDIDHRLRQQRNATLAFIYQ